LRAAKPIINHITLTKARVNLGAVIKRVHLKGEYFILEKDGIPVAGLMGVDELEDYLELRDPKVIKQIAQSKKDLDAGRVRSAWKVLDELKRTGGTKGKRGAKKPAKTA
jgi:PHD/YefM family antitoxin component YafN of YafNO toxin-antitoxin module